MNAAINEEMHCVAAEPHSVFLHVGVVLADRSEEVAYETAVLGRLRHGYRVFQLRNALGTRIELCHLLVHITFGSLPNHWTTPRQLRVKAARLEQKLKRSTSELQSSTSTFDEPPSPVRQGSQNAKSVRIVSSQGDPA